MKFLFFSYDGDFNKVSEVIYKSLGITQYLTGDSYNVLGGAYSDFSVFGVRIKLELNSYDYEDDYNYMLSLQTDSLRTISVDDKIVEYVNEVVKKLLYINLSLVVAEEKNGSLEIFKG
jgi:hypothetical protein